MVSHPVDYQWSSYRINAASAASWLTPHDEYIALGKTLASRTKNYKALLAENLPDHSLSLIRRAAGYCQPIGSEAFKKSVEKEHGLTLGQGARGRPRKYLD